MQLVVECGKITGPLEHFWQSIGFSPASALLSADMRQAMAYAGSVPNGGITYVRPHYFLDLVQVRDMGTDRPVYDWSALDSAVDVLVTQRLKPFFELMGSPGGFFTDFADDFQLHSWRRLVRDAARHFIERYGQAEVRGWYFETWNEPDLKWWTHGEQAFCSYYDACSEGLKDADPQLRMGGPGTSLHLGSLFKVFLAHCDTGKNYFTGEQGVRLDFISYHDKGMLGCKEDIAPLTAALTGREGEIVSYVQTHHPRLAGVQFWNTECDPQCGWQDTHTWHARPYYAAIVCKMINQHLLGIIDGLGTSYFLSHDNGFLGTWGHRTLLTRFGDITDPVAQAEHKTHLTDLQEDPGRRRFEMVKKPVFNALVLLSLLGDRRCAIRGAGNLDSDLGAIATLRGQEQVAVMVYHSRDDVIASGSERIKLAFENLPFAQGEPMMLVHYRIDRDHGNPFQVWEKLIAPQHPDGEQITEMRQHQELTLLEAPRQLEAADGTLSIKFDLPLPGVSLVLLMKRPSSLPGQVEGVRGERYEGTLGQEEILLQWGGTGSRAIQTFEVLFARSVEGPYRRVNQVDTLCTTFLHLRKPGQPGVYRVRAVDYWDRDGELSEPFLA